MKDEKIPPRQQWAALFVGGLSHGAAGCGALDWRWALAAAAVGASLGCLLLRFGGGRLSFEGLRGRLLKPLYGGWAVVMMSAVFFRASRRLELTNAKPGDGGWILLLMALALVWVAWRGSGTFFRAAEVFRAAMIVLLVAVVLFALPRVEWRWLMLPSGGWAESMAAMIPVMSIGLFLLPYIYSGEPQWRRLAWQGGVGVVAAVLAALTVGLLSPAVAARIGQPFFVATGVLGSTVRAEGLISAVWLLPDLTLVGLLAQAIKSGTRAALGVTLAAGLALSGIASCFSAAFLAFGTAVLLLITLVLPCGRGK